MSDGISDGRPHSIDKEEWTHIGPFRLRQPAKVVTYHFRGEVQIACYKPCVEVSHGTYLSSLKAAQDEFAFKMLQEITSSKEMFKKYVHLYTMDELDSHRELSKKIRDEEYHPLLTRFNNADNSVTPTAVERAREKYKDEQKVCESMVVGLIAQNDAVERLRKTLPWLEEVV